MSERPEWMPSEAALTSIEYHAEEALRLGSHRNTHDAMRAFAYRTGLRAQLAVLVELLPCAMRVYGDCEELPLEMVSVDIIEEKIDELRKELEG